MLRHAGQQWPQRIASVAGIIIGRVIDPRKGMGPDIGFDVAARHVQPGAQQRHAAQPLHRHGRQAIEAGAAQQLQQHGLGLVVEMMGGQQEGGASLGAKRVERGVAGFARGLLDAAPRIDGHAHATHMAFDIDGSGHPYAGGLPRIRIGLQAMVDVQRDQPHRRAGGIAPRSGGMQQRRGIASARQRNRDRRPPARNNKGRTRGNALCDLVDQQHRRISSRRLP